MSTRQDKINSKETYKLHWLINSSIIAWDFICPATSAYCNAMVAQAM